ncbi:T9SS C-terminal target domain-containing protein [bacterium]|nr:MAG: T9SS C-terminal target domain-containing protein [bacterium]
MLNEMFKTMFNPDPSGKSRILSGGKKIILLFIITFCCSYLSATIINIPADQPTIQAGINIADDGDIVLVQPGTYIENINYSGKLITVASLFLTTQDTSYISQTIIDGNQNGSVVTFGSGEDSTAVLIGFKITNGQGSGSWTYTGGGITCKNSSSPSLKNVTITENNADAYGGGIDCCNSSPSLVNVTISGNSAVGDYSYGGGIYCDSYSNPNLENITIKGNSAYYGGGIYCKSSPSLLNVTITGNSADYGGGGIYFDSSSPSLKNVTITGNSAYDGGGIYFDHSSPSLENVTITGNIAADDGGGIYCFWYSSPSLVNCILCNNSPQEIYLSEYAYPSTITISYSDIQGGESGIITNNNGTVYWLEGNIDADPLFLDPANGDYHLTENSPCIDAGDPDSPLDPDGTRADMGAYYYDQITSIWPGDTDYSGIVNEEDILPIGVYWRDTGFPRSSISFEWVGNDYPGGWDEPCAALADCNGDGEVNITDVLAICLNWNKTHSTVLESPFIPNNLEQYRDNFVEIYNSLGNSEIEIKIRNHIAEKFDLPIIEIMKVNKLCQNYPNPFNPDNPRFNRGGTIISFSLTTANAENAKIEIYNVKGQKVRTMESGECRMENGKYTITWDGRDENNKPVSSGIYFYKLHNNNKVIDYKKMLIIK